MTPEGLKEVFRQNLDDLDFLKLFEEYVYAVASGECENYITCAKMLKEAYENN